MKTKKNIKDIKEVKEQKTQPWSSEEKASLEHTQRQIEIQKLAKERELNILELGQANIDDEVEWQIGSARIQVKATELALEKCLLDKVNKYHEKDGLFKIDEAKLEIKRLEQNLKAMQKQIEAGKQVPEDVTPKETAEGPAE